MRKRKVKEEVTGEGWGREKSKMKRQVKDEEEKSGE